MIPTHNPLRRARSWFSSAEVDAAQQLLERSVPPDILSDWCALKDLRSRSLEDPSVLLMTASGIRSVALRQALGRFPACLRAAQSWLRRVVVAVVAWNGIVALMLWVGRFVIPPFVTPFMFIFFLAALGALGIAMDFVVDFDSVVGFPDSPSDSDCAVDSTSNPSGSRTWRPWPWLARRTAAAFWRSLLDLRTQSAWRSLGWGVTRPDLLVTAEILLAGGVDFDGRADPLLAAARCAGCDERGRAGGLLRLAVAGAAVDRARNAFFTGGARLGGVPLPFGTSAVDHPAVSDHADRGHGLTASLRRLARDLRAAPSPGARIAPEGVVEVYSDALSTHEVRA